jgi:hypothetical protein
MAIVNNGTLNGLAPERLPIGYTLPTATVILDYHYKINTVISLQVSATALSTAVATMGAIVTGTNSAISTFLTANYLSTANITAYSIINNLTTNFAPSKNNTSQTFLKSATTNSYLVSVTIYVKAI